jgi:hypothetical protein
MVESLPRRAPSNRHHVASAMALALSLAPAAALAQRAPYARPDELRAEGLAHQLDLSMRLGYAHVLDPARVGGLTHEGTFSLRTRALVGRRVAWCGGLDGAIGGADTGLVYNATLYALGLAARWDRGGMVGLSGGVGVSGASGAIPFAVRVPAELSVTVNLGPTRLTAWAGVAWVFDDARKHGSTWQSFADEVDAGLTLRIGRQRPYWSSVSAGAGPSIGFSYREFMGTRALGVTLGFDLSGAR